MKRAATALIPTLLCGMVFGWLLATNAWSTWGVEAMEPRTPASASFADLANITATADCLTNGTDITVCDPYGRPYQPYVVLPARLLSWLHLGTEQTGTLGLLLAGVYVATIAALGLLLAAHWSGRVAGLVGGQSALAVAAILPPPVLAVERGQIELASLALTVLALAALAAQLRWLHWTGAIAGIGATIAKFFAIGLFLPAIRRRPAWAGIAGLLVSAAFLVLNLDAVTQASAAARTDLAATSKSQFGAATLVATIVSVEPIGYTPSAQVAANWATVRIIGGAVFLVAVLVAAVLVSSRAVQALTASPLGWWLVIGSTGVLVPPYLLGASHDYRLVFAIPLLVGSVIWAGVSGSRTLPLVLSGLVLLAMLTSAAMVPTPQGLIWGKWWLVAGDVALLVVLAVGTGTWLRALVTRVS